MRSYPELSPIVRVGSIIPAHTTSSQVRFTALDSLRGIAALGVVLTHVVSHGFPGLELIHTPLRMLANGRCFVIFFFVLSGFVLAAALLRGDPLRGYANYVLRRFARIYLPYVAAGLLALLVAGLLQGPMAPGAVFDHMVLGGTEAGISLNSPSWSLVYELRISIILPMLCWLFLFRPSLFWAGLVAAVLAEEVGVALSGIGQFPYSSDTLGGAILVTTRFTVCFAAGLWLAHQVLNQRAWLQRIRGPVVPLLGVAAFGLMSVLLDQTSVLGAVATIVLALRSRVFDRVLNMPVLAWLGRISFSLYLTHLLVMKVVMAALQDSVGLGSSACVAAMMSLPAAVLFYRCIERPSIALSNMVKARGRWQADAASRVSAPATARS